MHAQEAAGAEASNDLLDVKKIYFVRHGRTAYNAVGRFQGLIDNPLDETGREQVGATAQRLRSVAFDYAVGSDLIRAVETMAIVLAGRLLQPAVDQGWRERDFGSWEGLTWAQITARTPELAASLAIDVRSFQPENGEEFAQVKARVSQAYERVLSQLADGEIALVVAHAGVFHALLDALFGSEREATLIPPAGLLIIEIEAGRPVLLPDEKVVS